MFMLSLRVTFHRMGGKSECCRKKKRNFELGSRMHAQSCLVCLPALLSLFLCLPTHALHSNELQLSDGGGGPSPGKKRKKTPDFLQNLM